MDNNNQKIIKDLRIKLEIQKTHFEQEVLSRQKAEDQIAVLNEELKDSKSRLASFEKGMEERIRFDVLLSEISADFINMPSDQLDKGIEDAQRRVCECLELDLSALWQWDAIDSNTLQLTHLYRPLGGPPVPEKMDANEFFPWCQQELRSGKTITVSCIDNVPPEAFRDQEAWRHYGVKTSLTIPLAAGKGPVFGGLSFNDMKNERVWSDTLVKRLQLVAQIFANALARKRYDEILSESESRLSLATDAAGAGLWVYELTTGKIWVSKKTRELFHFSLDEDLDYDGFSSNIHPEDRDSVNQAVQQALQADDVLQIDYRIVLSDGTIRWISSRGSRYLDSAGKPDRIMGVSVDRTEHKQMESQLRENLQFETILSDISAHFVNLQPNEVDCGIEDTQRLVCECLGLDMSVLWQREAANPDAFVLTHIYRLIDHPPVPKRMVASENVPWFFQQAMTGKMVAISSIDEIPPEAADDIDTWRYYGVNTTLNLPLKTGNDSPFGVVSFNDMKLEKRNWSETLIKRLQLVAQIFANALARKCSDEILRESESRLSLATNAAGVGLWVMDIHTQKVWVSAKLRDLYYFNADGEVFYQNFFEKIHSEDRAQVQQAVIQAIRSGGSLHCDYRILLPQGNVRWICSRGHRRLKPDGEPDRLMGVSIDITERVMLENHLRESIQEIAKLKKRLENENLYLQKEIELLGEHGGIVGQSLAIKRILAEAGQVAKTDSSILILGETGTGKEMLARAIHQMSARKDRPLVTVNCASLPPTLIESELFGREKGAYTGAMTQMIGRFEIADGSTLFLDEIGELPIELQSKLLRVLEEGVFERLGSTKPLHVDVRIIAATNRDIENEAAKGRFRKDLFYRLNVFPIVMPPLRERPEDIPLLVWAFIKELKQRMGKEIETISKKSVEALRSYSWPGNVRELRNVIEHAMILSCNSTLTVHLPKSGQKEKDDTHHLGDIDRRHIVSVLEKTGWRVGGKGGASETLGLKRSTLYSKMKKLGINRPNL